MIRSVFLFLMLAQFASAQDAKSVRLALVRALNNKTSADSLYSHLKAAPHQTPLVFGFTASARALQAKHAWNPFTKVGYVKDAEKLFTKAIQQEPHNIEIRFMRFSMEHYIPAFLGFNKNLTTDRDVMIDQLQKKHVNGADASLVDALVKFLLESKRCTPQQEAYLRKHLKDAA